MAHYTVNSKRSGAERCPDWKGNLLRDQLLVRQEYRSPSTGYWLVHGHMTPNNETGYRQLP